MILKKLLPALLIALISAIYPIIMVKVLNESSIDAFSTFVISFAVLFILYRINFGTK